MIYLIWSGRNEKISRRKTKNVCPSGNLFRFFFLLSLARLHPPPSSPFPYHLSYKNIFIFFYQINMGISWVLLGSTIGIELVGFIFQGCYIAMQRVLCVCKTILMVLTDLDHKYIEEERHNKLISKIYRPGEVRWFNSSTPTFVTRSIRMPESTHASGHPQDKG